MTGLGAGRPAGPLLAAVLFAVLVTPLSAQEAAAPAAGSVTLPQIEVSGTAATATAPVAGYVAPVAASGTKTDTPLMETPQSITVITRDRIDAQAARSVEEALRYTPGVTAELSGFDPRFDGVRIR